MHARCSRPNSSVGGSHVAQRGCCSSVDDMSSQENASDAVSSAAVSRRDIIESQQ